VQGIGEKGHAPRHKTSHHLRHCDKKIQQDRNAYVPCGMMVIMCHDSVFGNRYLITYLNAYLNTYFFSLIIQKSGNPLHLPVHHSEACLP
jgi:hypothetical protein